jgi:hypothetical protein
LLAADLSISFTIIGRGQDYEIARAAAADNRSTDWIDWVEPDELPSVVATHEVSLGIFGTSPKALRVVPTKVFQAAAAGTAVVTSDTVPQRAALGACAEFVRPGDAAALATTLRLLARDRARLCELRALAYGRATGSFRPASVIAPLYARVA